MGTRREVDTVKVRVLCGMSSIANSTVTKPWILILVVMFLEKCAWVIQENIVK
jgi:hypothetical protein